MQITEANLSSPLEHAMLRCVPLLVLILMALTAKADVPEEALLFDFDVQTGNISRSQERKIEKALDVISAVFASEEFKERVLQHRFNGRRRFAENRGMSNRKIYETVLAGSESFDREADSTMDLQLSFYTNRDSSVIGYTYPNSTRVWINTHYFNRFSAASVAANLVHEWLHKLGFDHSYHRTHARKYSVPYAIGRLVKELGEEYLESGEDQNRSNSRERPWYYRWRGHPGIRNH